VFHKAFYAWSASSPTRPVITIEVFLTVSHPGALVDKGIWFYVSLDAIICYFQEAHVTPSFNNRISKCRREECKLSISQTKSSKEFIYTLDETLKRVVELKNALLWTRDVLVPCCSE